MRNEILEDMIEIEPLDSDGFLKVRETLTRVGYLSKRQSDKPMLIQQCHVLHSRGRYFICHFKQLFLLDGRTSTTNYSERDEDCLFKTVNLLEKWGMVTPLDIIEQVAVHVHAIPYADKANYVLKSNYKLGKKNDKSQNSNNAAD